MEKLSKSYTIKTATIDKELAADKAEASETYTKAYTALYRQAVEKQYEIQKQLLDDHISASKSLNDLLWSTCGSANAMLFDSAEANDPVPDILAYLRSQSQAEIAAMVASAELYGEFQVGWRSEMLASYSAYLLQDNSNDNDVRLSAIENDIEWATKVAAARNAYYLALGSATSEYNNAVIDALEAYNETVLGAEITRAKAHFDAVESYSKDSYDLETNYVKAQFETSKKTTLAALDAAIVQMVGLAELDAYFARKIADEYGAITVDDDFGVFRNQIDYDNRLASNLKRQEINDTKTATDKTNRRQARRDNNNDYTEYFEAWFALQTTYEIAIATANEEYYNTVTTAEENTINDIASAKEEWAISYDILNEQYRNALQTIDENDEIGISFSTSLQSGQNSSFSSNNNNKPANPYYVAAKEFFSIVGKKIVSTTNAYSECGYYFVTSNNRSDMLNEAGIAWQNSRVTPLAERLYDVTKAKGYSDENIANIFSPAYISAAAEITGMNAGAEAIVGARIHDGFNLSGEERLQNVAYAISGASGTLAVGLGFVKPIATPKTPTQQSFISQMTAEEALRYQNYWLGKMPINRTPTGNPTTPVNDIIGVPIADETFVHFAPEVHNPVHIPDDKTFWFKYVDVKNMTPTQVRGVIGPETSGGSINGTRFIHISVKPEGNFRWYGSSEGSFKVEYTNEKPVHVKTIELHPPK
jgi:hypothetical protein